MLLARRPSQHPRSFARCAILYPGCAARESAASYPVEVSFDGQNRLRENVVVSQADVKFKSYCDPRPPYGSLHLTLGRSS